jgi:hypothetical protein
MIVPEKSQISEHRKEEEDKEEEDEKSWSRSS